MSELTKIERSALRPVAEGWRQEYYRQLSNAGNNPGTTLDEWIEIAWTFGLLDHVAPTDPEVWRARGLLGRTLWRERTDPVLYWRALYACECLRANIKHTQTSGPAAQACLPIISTMGSLGRDRLTLFFPELRRHGGWSWYQRICELLVARAQKELRSMGVTPHDPVLRRHSTGIFRDLPVEIDAILDDGTIWLRASDPGSENRNLLEVAEINVQLTDDGRGVCPSLIDASAFTTPEDDR